MRSGFGRERGGWRRFDNIKRAEALFILSNCRVEIREYREEIRDKR